MKTMLLLLCSWVLLLPTFAQTTLSGKVTDQETGESILFGNVALFQNGILVTGMETDFDGNYTFKDLAPGVYDVEVTYVGYAPQKITGVKVLAGKDNRLDIQMTGGVVLSEVCVVQYKIPLVQQDNTTSGKVITSAQIKKLPKRRVKGLAAITSGLKSKKGKKNTNIRGSRANATDYYVDGVRVGGRLIKEREENSGEDYAPIIENSFQSPNISKFSTFGIDVDQAAYTNVRRYINNGQLPPKDAVRTEELINYFNYDYPQPTDKHPFEIYTELGQCPWNQEHWILHIGLQGKDVSLAETPPNQLVFLIDVSSSMRGEDRLPLVKESFQILLDKLRPQDQVAIVTYGASAKTVLNYTAVSEKDTIQKVLNSLVAQGGTAGEAGLEMAYKLAKEHYNPQSNNRILIASDGDFNIGAFDNKQIKSIIKKKRKTRIYITVLGFGMGNYKDSKMEIMADHGNGNYFYINEVQDAEKVLGREAGNTLFTIAKNVKLQLEFDSKKVGAYRLIGYENRLLTEEDFENDLKDAGDLGAGHSVTALYEIIPGKGESMEDGLGRINLRYMFPDGNQSYFLRHELKQNTRNIAETSDDFRFSAAVAGLSLLLQQSVYSGNLDWPMVIDLANQAKGKDTEQYREQFVQLVRKAETIHTATQVSQK